VSWRVKVYRLNEEGQWDDRGTGRARVTSGPACVRVEREEDRSVVLVRSPVCASSEAYQKQGENIITWDSTGSCGGEALRNAGKTCIALSFQEREGCDRVWDELMAAQSAMASRDDEEARCGHKQQARVLLKHALGARGDSLFDASFSESGDWRAPPEPTSPDAAAEWTRCLARAAACPGSREFYARRLLDDDAAAMRRLLVTSVREAERRDDVEALRTAADAAKLVVLLNEPPLVEALVDDHEMFEGLLGALEYAADVKKATQRAEECDPTWSPLSSAPDAVCPDTPDEPVAVDTSVVERTAREARRVSLRSALRRSERVEVVPIADQVLKARISQHFRASVLRDALVRPGMDEAQLSALHSLVFFNTNDILRRLHHETDYLAKVVQCLYADDARTNALRFLVEMVGLARSAQMVVREGLYEYAVTRAQLYEALADVLARRATAADRAACLEVASAFLRADPSSMRRHVLAAAAHPPPPTWAETTTTTEDEADDCVPSLLHWLCRLCSDAELCSVAAQAVKLCAESETMEDGEREAFLAVLYEQHYVAWLSTPLFDDAACPEACVQVCEVLTYCVRAHAYRIKYFLLRHNVAGRVVALATSARRSTQLAAVRFVRSCLGTKDDFFARYLLKNGALAPVVALLATPFDTLLTSAVAELVEFIRLENVKVLVEHLARAHADKFANSPRLLDALRTRLAQNEDTLDRATTRVPDRRDRLALHDRDEAYFEEDDDDDDDDALVLRPDDDDAFRPRPRCDPASDDEDALLKPFAAATHHARRRHLPGGAASASGGSGPRKHPLRFEIRLHHAPDPNAAPKRPRLAPAPSLLAPPPLHQQPLDDDDHSAATATDDLPT